MPIRTIPLEGLDRPKIHEGLELSVPSGNDQIALRPIEVLTPWQIRHGDDSHESIHTGSPVRLRRLRRREKRHRRQCKRGNVSALGHVGIEPKLLRRRRGIRSQGHTDVVAADVVVQVLAGVATYCARGIRKVHAEGSRHRNTDKGTAPSVDVLLGPRQMRARRNEKALIMGVKHRLSRPCHRRNALRTRDNCLDMGHSGGHLIQLRHRGRHLSRRAAKEDTGRGARRRHVQGTAGAAGLASREARRQQRVLRPRTKRQNDLRASGTRRLTTSHVRCTLILGDVHVQRCTKGHAHEHRRDAMEQAVRRVAQRVSGDGRDVEHLDSLLERKGLE